MTTAKNKPDFAELAAAHMKVEHPKSLELPALSSQEVDILAERLSKKFAAAVLLLLLIAQPALAAVDLSVLEDKIIMAESSGNPRAIGDSGRSRGLMQIQEATWKRHTSESFSRAFEPALNRVVGLSILTGIVKEYRARGIEPSEAYIVWAYNTGSPIKEFLPKYDKKRGFHAWTWNHPNAVYREIYRKELT